MVVARSNLGQIVVLTGLVRSATSVMPRVAFVGGGGKPGNCPITGSDLRTLPLVCLKTEWDGKGEGGKGKDRGDHLP